MNVLKKILQITGYTILVLVVIVPFFMSRDTDKENNKVEIQYWYSTGQNEQKPYYISAFNAAHNNIEIKSVVIPWQEQEKKVLTALLSGNSPDVINQFSPLVKWASRMALRPLDDYIARDNFDTTKIFPSLWKEMKWQGHTFGIPVYTASYAFFINRKLLKEAGIDPDYIPKTWDEVRELSKKMTKVDAKGYYQQIGFIPFYEQSLIPAQSTLPTPIIMAWQLGAAFIDSSGLLNLDNPSMRKACQWIYHYLQDFDFEKLATFTAGFGYGDQHCFVSDKVAMMILPSTFPEHIQRYHPGMDYTIGMIPTFPGHATTSFSGCWWLAIPRESKHPEEAWTFIRFMADKEVQLAAVNAMEENLFPANQNAAYDKRFNKDRETNIFVKHIELAHSPAVVPMAHDVFWREFYNAVERIMQQNAAIESALNQGEKMVNHELKKNLEYDEYVRSKMEFLK